MTSETSCPALTVMSSMATRHVLSDLISVYERRSGSRVSLVSVGGVEAARRIRAGEGCDIVVLAAEALRRLGDDGWVDPGSTVDVARSRIAVAVPADAPRPDITSEQSVREAILHARKVGYSTGPSGNHIIALLKHWGVHETVSPRLVEAPPGVPVGSLVADGTVELGFQQMSELIHQTGIDIVGMLPSPIEGEAIFSAAVSSSTTNLAAAQGFLMQLIAPESDALKIRHGMQPV